VRQGSATDPVFTWREPQPTQVPHDKLPAVGDALTVTAWCRTEVARSEGLQPLVSRWVPRPSFDAFSACDASRVGGLDTRGFYGAIFDGRFIYYCPIRHREDRRTVHGCVLRYDTHRDFRDHDAYRAYDAGHTDGLVTKGFYGAAFDGRHLFFIPRDDGHVHHSRFLRYDTCGDFCDGASWRAHDAQHPHSFQGAAFDGRYIYCCPGYTKPVSAPFGDDEASGVVMRLDTAGDFGDPASYRTFDAGSLGADAVSFDGAAFDGRHVYFVPLQTGTVLRYDTAAAFDERSAWRAYDATPLGMGGNVGAVYDGRHLYFVPFGHGRMVRLDTAGDIGDRDAWEVHDAGGTPGIGPTGYKGGFFDGRFVYYVPFRGPVPESSPRSPYHGTYLRYDTTCPFAAAESWQAADAGLTDGLATTAFTAGATDGRFLYAAPWRGDLDGGWMHGRILRYDTVGTEAAFSLRFSDYGHNGGLCAALPGPTFLINTPAGARSVSSHQALPPGRHYLVGLYDGASLALFVDGERVATREARGEVHDAAVDLAIGHIASARFEGSIESAEVHGVARDDEWIRARAVGQESSRHRRLR